jgi:excisionase family DNA binding protein
VSLADAAERVGVTTRTLRRWIAAGVLPASRVGPRLVRVSLDDLDALMRPIPTARRTVNGRLDEAG